LNPIYLDKLLRLVADPESVRDLCIYFGAQAPPGSPIFSGRLFGSLGLDGYRDDNPNRFTAVDLLAVQCLSVTVPIEVAIDLLEGELGGQVGDLLGRIDSGIDLGTKDAQRLVDDGWEADQAWQLLKRQDDVGWVTAGKLLARKRPRLIPIWDNVVRCALGRPPSAWLWLDNTLREKDGALLQLLAQTREDAGLTKQISLLRTLDVVVWMRHRNLHRPSRCPGLVL
jgi:hypothetical protein